MSLLNHLARWIANLLVIIVTTFRDNEVDLGGPLIRTLNELSRLNVLDRISLHGLPAAGVGETLRALSGREPPEVVVSLVTSYIDGNPLFVEELYKHLEEQRKLFDPGGQFISEIALNEIHVPETLRLTIGRRLARLSNATQKVLAVAAVIGYSFGFELLEAATLMDADALLDCVEEAERASLILSRLERLEARFQFSHELTRRAVVEGLSAPRRQRLHASVADAIERIHASALDEHSSDLAHHLSLAPWLTPAGRFGTLRWRPGGR
ncbi:MAG: ATP-binding protein [Candidatus Binataceae bacterium]